MVRLYYSYRIYLREKEKKKEKKSKKKEDLFIIKYEAEEG